MIHSAFRSVINFVRYRNPAERKARKYVDLFDFYFWQSLEIVDFARDIALSERQARQLCGYIAGFVDTALALLGEEIGSAPAFIAVHIIVTTEFGDVQKNNLIAKLGCDVKSEGGDEYGRAAEIGCEDATAYIEQKQKYNFAKFLYQELRPLCRVTNADLTTQLSTPRKT